MRPDWLFLVECFAVIPAFILSGDIPETIATNTVYQRDWLHAHTNWWALVYHDNFNKKKEKNRCQTWSWAAVHCCGGWTRLNCWSLGSRLWTSAPWEQGSRWQCSAWRPQLPEQQWCCLDHGWCVVFLGLLWGRTLNNYSHTETFRHILIQVLKKQDLLHILVICCCSQSNHKH